MNVVNVVNVDRLRPRQAQAPRQTDRRDALERPLARRRQVIEMLTMEQNRHARLDQKPVAAQPQF